MPYEVLYNLALSLPLSKHQMKFSRMRVELVFQIFPDGQTIFIRGELDVKLQDEQRYHTADLSQRQRLTNATVAALSTVSVKVTHLLDLRHT